MSAPGFKEEPSRVVSCSFREPSWSSSTAPLRSSWAWLQWHCGLEKLSVKHAFVGESSRSNTIRGQQDWEPLRGNLPLRGSLRGRFKNLSKISDNLWKISQKLKKPLKTSQNLWKRLKTSQKCLKTLPLRLPLRDPLRGRFLLRGCQSCCPYSVAP